MKTKLYHKVLKLAAKAVKDDDRQSVWGFIESIDQKVVRYLMSQLFTVRPKIEKKIRLAILAHEVWTNKCDVMTVKDENLIICRPKFRYPLHEDICRKYDRYRRRYWSDEEMLQRAIEGKTESRMARFMHKLTTKFT